MFAFHKRNSCSTFWGTRRENCLSTDQNHSEHPLQEKCQTRGNESSKSRTVSFVTDCLLDLRLLLDHWDPWFCRKLCRPIHYQFAKWSYSGIRFKSGTEFFLSMKKFPHDDILEGLYKLRIRESQKLKTALELYDLETHQKKLGPDYHRLKTMVKRSIEQEIRNKNFGARNGNFEKNAVVKNQGTK